MLLHTSGDRERLIRVRQPYRERELFSDKTFKAPDAELNGMRSTGTSPFFFSKTNDPKHHNNK